MELVTPGVDAVVGEAFASVDDLLLPALDAYDVGGAGVEGGERPGARAAGEVEHPGAAEHVAMLANDRLVAEVLDELALAPLAEPGIPIEEHRGLRRIDRQLRLRDRRADIVDVRRRGSDAQKPPADNRGPRNRTPRRSPVGHSAVNNRGVADR